ncbi:hypothetical protein CFOL_v3_27632 [Cephalotus follicularis]|uniref:Uncharacterized protein n=1 Tax=Cephalotus follicularis TaxID=3775 RepID=A0A1Q3CVU2_CEPFO|nr:hypothetical protein CFOL_v3_27632 [Cephalotus follicularis]
MNIQAGSSTLTSHSFWPPKASSYYISHSRLKFFCSKGDSQEPQQSGDDDNNNNKGDKLSMDWDKAWSNFRKKGKNSLFAKFSLDKYVTWNPRPSNYPLSEEVDPIKRTERSNLRLWTSPMFTLVGAIVVVTFLLVYTILAPVK